MFFNIFPHRRVHNIYFTKSVTPHIIYHSLQNIKYLPTFEIILLYAKYNDIHFFFLDMLLCRSAQPVHVCIRVQGCLNFLRYIYSMKVVLPSNALLGICTCNMHDSRGAINIILKYVGQTRTISRLARMRIYNIQFSLPACYYMILEQSHAQADHCGAQTV